MATTEKDAKKAAKNLKGSKTGTTHLAILVDESGSMSGNQEAVVTGVNEFLETFADKKKVRFWCGFFDYNPGSPRLRVKADHLKIGDVPKLGIDSYRPRGGTPLNDSIADTITALEPKVKKGDKALVVIITDGYENASEMSTEDTKKLIEKYEKKEEWAFLYLGANQHAETSAAALGLNKRGHAHNFTSSPKGTSNTFRSTAHLAGVRMAAPDKLAYEAGAQALYDATGGVIAEDEDQTPDAQDKSGLWTPQSE